MDIKLKDILAISLILALSIISNPGCAFKFQKHHDKDLKEIEVLEKDKDKMGLEMSRLKAQVDVEREKNRRAMEELRRSLSKEIEDLEVIVQETKKGIVITFVSEVLFDSGKAIVRPEAYEKLDKVAKVLHEVVEDRKIAIEGHTDNEPIKYSGWKSNWELSSHRALSVLHYLVDKQGIVPERVSATGYGEYNPVVDNDTPEGRQKNRRVEIVILPEKVSKIKDEVILEEKESLNLK